MGLASASNSTNFFSVIHLLYLLLSTATMPRHVRGIETLASNVHMDLGEAKAGFAID